MENITKFVVQKPDMKKLIDWMDLIRIRTRPNKNWHYFYICQENII